MYKFIRWCRQNTNIVVGVIVIAIFIWLMLMLWNDVAKKSLEQASTNNANNQTANTNNYVGTGTSVVDSSTALSEGKETEIGTVLDQFLDYCVNGNTAMAYDMLSDACKNKKFSTEQIFRINYCEEKFDTNKTYSFELWTLKSNEYVYRVKIFENPLITGKVADTYIEDYYCVSYNKNNKKYEIGVDGFISSEEVDKSTEVDDIKISLGNVDTYMEEMVYTVEIVNNTNKTIMIDTKNFKNSIQLIDSYDTTTNALTYENQDEDFIIEANGYKKIQLKFSVTYRANFNVESVAFNNIVKDYEYYLKNQASYEDFINIKIEQ